VSENIPLSDRERAEGFHRAITTAVSAAVPDRIVTRTPESERLDDAHGSVAQ
jgi:hypothetical protein